MKLLAKYSVIFVSLLAFSIVGIGCVADDDSTNNDVITKEKNPEEEPVVLPESSSEPEVTYTIMFDKNAADATGTMESQTAKKSSRLTLAANAFVRSGYTFKGWSTKSDGRGANYSDKAAFKPMSDLKLFALWSKTLQHCQIAMNRKIHLLKNPAQQKLIQKPLHIEMA